MGSFWRYLTAPLRALAAAPRWFLGLTVPVRAGLLAAVFCVLCVVIFTILYAIDPDPVKQRMVKGWVYWLVVILLVIVIPFVVWYALKLWLEGDVSRYPDIDYAWKAGLDALKRHGLELGDVPLFLILGAANDAAARTLLQASRLGLRVKEVPQGPAALHWFANPEGIYLVCTDTCCLSKLAELGSSAADRGGYAPTAASAPAQQASSIRATVVPGDMGAGPGAPEPASALPPTAGADIRGTMNIGGGAVGQTMMPFEAGVPDKPVPTLSPEDLAESSRRLEYLCGLLRRVRAPLCPVNGVLTLLPYEVIQTGPGGGLEVRKAAREDLAVATRTLQLHCPVTTLVTGMHSEEGFRELVQRVGLDKARGQRFGKGFGLRDPSSPAAHPAMGTAEQLAAVGTHACGAFEDWVYALFRARDALTHPGNRKLYYLLCKVRLNLRDRLAQILASAYGAESPGRADGTPFFGGCYFAATGPGDTRQAFVKSVFDKLAEQQSDVQWTDEALRRDGTARTLAYAGLLVNVGLVIVIVWAWLAVRGG